jgi:two-component SAPR family response regulator
MTNLNGCEFGIKVKELTENIKVILTSAYDSIEDNNKLNFELLRKPITLQELLDRINVSLNNNDTASYRYYRGIDET